MEVTVIYRPKLFDEAEHPNLCYDVFSDVVKPCMWRELIAQFGMIRYQSALSLSTKRVPMAFSPE